MNAAVDEITHGTYAGYQKEIKRGLSACALCREAARLYMREYRKRGMPGAVREEKRNRARIAALWRLKDLHRADFDLLVADEMRVEARRAAS